MVYTFQATRFCQSGVYNDFSMTSAPLIAYLCSSRGILLEQAAGFWQLVIEIESMAISPLQEIPRLASNSIVNDFFLRPRVTSVLYHLFPWLPDTMKTANQDISLAHITSAVPPPPPQLPIMNWDSSWHYRKGNRWGNASPINTFVEELSFVS